jgi:hypothetical protein
VQNTTYYLLKKNDLPPDKIMNLKINLYLKTKGQLTYDRFREVSN